MILFSIRPWQHTNYYQIAPSHGYWTSSKPLSALGKPSLYNPVKMLNFLLVFGLQCAVDAWISITCTSVEYVEHHITIHSCLPTNYDVPPRIFLTWHKLYLKRLRHWYTKKHDETNREKMWCLLTLLAISYRRRDVVSNVQGTTWNLLLLNKRYVTSATSASQNVTKWLFDREWIYTQSLQIGRIICWIMGWIMCWMCSFILKGRWMWVWFLFFWKIFIKVKGNPRKRHHDTSRQS